MRKTSTALCLLFGMAMPAFAEPNVTVSIRPYHAITSVVMEGVGEPSLILDGNQSPHHFSLKPSQAAKLEAADLIIWGGETLETPLTKPIGTINPKASVLELFEADGLKLLPARFGHDHGEHAEGEHKHEEHAHDEHKHEEHAEGEHKHQEHAHDEHKHEEHAEMDTHIWLDPANATILANLIAEKLSEMDADNADTYKENAKRFAAKLDELPTKVDAILAPVRGREFIVYHDAYQYFENRFDMPVAGIVAPGDAIAPGAAHLSDIQKILETKDISCVIVEPGADANKLKANLNLPNANTTTLDALGIGMEPGSALYENMIIGIASTLAECLKPVS